jgi:integrase
MKRPPYLLREKTRHGKVVWYFRKENGPRIRIRGDYGTKEFMAEYQAALSGAAIAQPVRKKLTTDSLAWLVRSYRDSNAWMSLNAETRRNREHVLMQLEAIERPYDSITKNDMKLAIEKRADRPNVANHFIKTVRSLFVWAVDADILETNPTEGLKSLPVKTEGYHVWTEDEVAAFENRWPIGTRERLAMAVMLYTGVRRGDAVRIGRQHIKDGVISLKTEKTGTWIYLPVASELAEIIAATNTGNLSLICKADGSPMNKRYFGQWFREACVSAGVPGSCHGLRKAGATRLAEAGATIHELNSIFGWVGTDMAAHYTKSADSRRLAASGIAKLKPNKE